MPGFFKPGNKYSQGRPPKSKNQIEGIRRRIFFIVKRRIMREKDLSTVSTTDLLKFLASVMPKEGTNLANANVTYISNIPREEEKKEIPEVISNRLEEQSTVTLAEQVSADFTQTIEPTIELLDASTQKL